MRICTTAEGTLKFNGNSRSVRIRKAMVLLGVKEDTIARKIIMSNGRFDNNSKDYKRYAQAIKHNKTTKTGVIKVS